jgi:hypothetical protein
MKGYLLVCTFKLLCNSYLKVNCDDEDDDRAENDGVDAEEDDWEKDPLEAHICVWRLSISCKPLTENSDLSR